MPIVSSQITRSISKGQEKRLLMEAVDQTGRVWECRPLVDELSTGLIELAEWVVRLDLELPVYEAQAEAKRAKQGDSLPAAHQTQAELDKAVLSILMRLEDALQFSNTLQWFRDFEVRGGPNTNSRASYLGVSSQDYGLVATRYNQITGLVDNLNADAARVWDVGMGW